jgi:hypothetical protein
MSAKRLMCMPQPLNWLLKTIWPIRSSGILLGDIAKKDDVGFEVTATDYKLPGDRRPVEGEEFVGSELDELGAWFASERPQPKGKPT